MAETRTKKRRGIPDEVKELRAEAALLRSIAGELLDRFQWGRGKAVDGKIIFPAEMESKRFFELSRQVYECGRESGRIQNYMQKLERLLVWAREYDRLEVSHLFSDRAAEIRFVDIKSRFREAIREIDPDESAESGQGIESVETAQERREE